MWGTLEVWMTPSELWTPYYIVNHIVNGYLGCQIPPCGWRPRDLSTSVKEFLFNAGGIYRIFVLFGFLGLFVLEWLIRKPTSVFWARLVESDKPVFTLLFGGAAAAAKLVTEAVKHYST